jgi:hypothetical protein
MGLKGDQKRYPSRLSASREAPPRAVKATTASPTITQPHKVRQVTRRIACLTGFPASNLNKVTINVAIAQSCGAMPSRGPAMRLATKPPRASGVSIRLSTPPALRTDIHRGIMTTTTRRRESESRPAQGVAANARGKGWPMGRAACMGPAGNMIQVSAQRFLTRSRQVQAFSLSGRRVTYSESERMLRAADRRRERRAGKRAPTTGREK